MITRNLHRNSVKTVSDIPAEGNAYIRGASRQRDNIENASTEKMMPTDTLTDEDMMCLEGLVRTLGPQELLALRNNDRLMLSLERVL